MNVLMIAPQSFFEPIPIIVYQQLLDLSQFDYIESVISIKPAIRIHNLQQRDNLHLQSVER
jgi:hypothetical protein